MGDDHLHCLHALRIERSIVMATQIQCRCRFSSQEFFRCGLWDYRVVVEMHHGHSLAGGS